MIVSDVPCTAAGVYTQNKVKGAPIFVRRSTRRTTQPVRCWSTAATPTPAMRTASRWQTPCESAAQALGIAAQDMIIASTGVIGQPLPLGPITSSMEKLVGSLSYEGSSKAAEAMLTTDLIKKEGAVEITLGGVPVRIGAMAKGSGMIHPNMATMLCFICSDAAIGADMLKKALKAAVDDTLNMVSVDGDTSTNDTCAILCNGLAGNREITAEDEDYTVFAAALKSLLIKLTRELARDGEGATKLIEVNLSGAPDTATAKKLPNRLSIPCCSSRPFSAAMPTGDGSCAPSATPMRRSTLIRPTCTLKALQGKSRCARMGTAWRFPRSLQGRSCCGTRLPWTSS